MHVGELPHVGKPRSGRRANPLDRQMARKIRRIVLTRNRCRAASLDSTVTTRANGLTQAFSPLDARHP